MAFGITGKYVEAGGRSVQFAAPYEQRRQKIASLPDRSVLILIVYAHGSPGMIGDDDADTLTEMLQKKMKSNGQIHLLGCSTAGIDGHFWNPVGGIGLLTRMIMYHGIPRMMGNPELASQWATNLAGDLSTTLSPT